MGGSNPLEAPRPGASTTPRTDFFEMFDPGAPWHRTAAGIQVMKLSPSLVLRANKASLSPIVANLNRRHIAIAVAFGWLRSPSDDLSCGARIEGVAHSGSAGLFSRLIKATPGPDPAHCSKSIAPSIGVSQRGSSYKPLVITKLGRTITQKDA